MPTRAIWATGGVITCLVALLVALGPPLMLEMRNAAFDGYQRSAPRLPVADLPVHIIDIDEASLDALGQWPWPRSYMAEMTNRLSNLGAAAIGFDILLAEPDRTSPRRAVANWQRFSEQELDPALDQALAGLPDHDALFAQALTTAPAVLALSGTAQPGPPPPAPKGGVSYTGSHPSGAVTRFAGAVPPLPMFQEVAQGIGLISQAASTDGVTRAIPMVALVGDALLPSLSAELLRVAQGAGGHVLRTSEASGEVSGGVARITDMRSGALSYPLDGNGQFRLHLGPPPAGRTTSAAAILSPDWQQLTPRIAGKILLIGSSAQDLFDLRTTALGTRVPGVTLHAQILEQILTGRFLTRPDWMPGLELLLSVLVGAMVTLLCTRDGPLPALVGTGLLIGTLALGGMSLFRFQGLLFDPSGPILAAVAVFLPAITLGIIGKENLRRSIQSRFAYFVPPALISEIAAQPEDTLTPQGAQRELTVIFVDLRGFTSITETMKPPDVVRLLNICLGEMSDSLIAHGATIDKYIGDAIMAFWNAPLSDPNHKTRALRSLPALSEALARANAQLAELGLPQVTASIGMNTGPAFVGLMGSRDRLNYSCVGDSVTQAARFEGLTRLYGVENCVGAPTLEGLPDTLRAVLLDLVAVKGRVEPVPVATVYRAEDTRMVQIAGLLEQARAAYLKQDWDTAEALFADLAALEGDMPQALSSLYSERIATHRLWPPPPDWDGHYVASSKG